MPVSARAKAKPMNDQLQSDDARPPAVAFGGTSIFVHDVPEALEFFQRVFGFKVQFLDEAFQCGDVDVGTAHVALVSHRTGDFLMPGNGERATKDGAGIELSFIVSDVPAAYAKAIAFGAAPLAAPKRMPWGATMAYLRGPEGVILGLSSPLESWRMDSPSEIDSEFTKWRSSLGLLPILGSTHPYGTHRRGNRQSTP